MGKHFTAIIHRKGNIVANDATLSTFGHLKLYQPIPNPTVFTTTLFTLNKHMASQSKTPRHTDIPTMIYP